MQGSESKHSTIAIHPVANGLIVEADQERRVFELAPGRRTRALHDVLQGVATLLAGSVGGLEVRIEVRDPSGMDREVQTRAPRLWLAPDEVEEEYGLGLSFLEKMRQDGTGPEYCKPGQRSVRYNRAVIEEWLRRNTVRTTGR